jgi:hypothetical protein
MAALNQVSSAYKSARVIVEKHKKLFMKDDEDIKSCSSSASSCASKSRKPSEYNLFMKTELSKIKEENINSCLTRKELMGILSERWQKYKIKCI